MMELEKGFGDKSTEKFTTPNAIWTSESENASPLCILPEYFSQ
jgi:hypothetical protein